MTFDPEKIPIWLRRNEEQQAQDRAFQDKLRSARGPGIRPNRIEAHLLRADAVARSATAQLEELRHSPNPDPLHVSTAEAQLAEALAAQGRFSEAAEIHPQPEQAERLAAIAEAVDRDDADEPCHCEVKIHEGRPISPEIVSEMVFSAKHQKLMPLVVCTACGDMNVKPAPIHLETRIQGIRDAHAEARRQIAKGEHPNGT